MADPARVLVVDDQAEMAEMIADDLAEHGYDAVAISSARQALRQIVTERFDALITDVDMPGVSGIALLRASTKLDPLRPVIVMTAYSTLQTAMEATGDGAYHYLAKPFQLDLLRRLLGQALEFR